MLIAAVRDESEAPEPLPAIWSALRMDAQRTSESEPSLRAFVQGHVLAHVSFESAVAHMVATKLSGAAVDSQSLYDLSMEALKLDPCIARAVARDIQAVCSRDPACLGPTEAFLFYKGIHALAAYRIAHWFWRAQSRFLARWIQSRLAEHLSVDIHPACRIGSGIFLDHAHGLVVGETAVIEDDVSILHSVTLGGTGKQSGDRHPKVRSGVLIGAGAQILGNIEVGRGAKIGAGSVVMSSVDPHVTVGGSLARVVGVPLTLEPALEMSHSAEKICSD